jgi:hypothetical protein
MALTRFNPYSVIGITFSKDVRTMNDMIGLPPGTQTYSPSGEFFFSNGGMSLNIYSVDSGRQHRHIATAYGSSGVDYIVSLEDTGELIDIKSSNPLDSLKIISVEGTSFGLVSEPDEPKPKVTDWIAEAFV